MASMPIVTVNLWYDRVVMDDAFVGLTGRTMQWIFDKRRVFGEAASHLSLVSARPKLAALMHEELIDLAAREVAARVARAHATPPSSAPPSSARSRRRSRSALASRSARARSRRLNGFVLAGDWTDTGLPGTIESAVAQRPPGRTRSYQLSVIDDQFIDH